MLKLAISSSHDVVRIGTRYSKTLSLKVNTDASGYGAGAVNVRILRVDKIKGDDVKHAVVASYHPWSKGQAERFVQAFKHFFEVNESNSVEQNFARFFVQL